MRRFRDPIRSDRTASRRSRRRAWGTPSHAVLAVLGLLLYFAILWFGTEVVGDNATRSALMSGLIVAIAGIGYAASRHEARG